MQPVVRLDRSSSRLPLAESCAAPKPPSTDTDASARAARHRRHRGNLVQQLGVSMLEPERPFMIARSQASLVV